jgi:hypothetical protein
MAIQFRCPGCSQPIEVDDVHAGQAAACPYCRRVVNVPSESTLGREPPGVARGVEHEEARERGAAAPHDASVPGASPAPPLPGGLHVGPAPGPRDQAARTFGNYALICTVIAVLLFAVVFIYSVAAIGQEMMKDPTSQPSPERIAEIQEDLLANQWLQGTQIVIAVLSLVGVILAAVSLKQSPRSNWRAIVSVVICGLFVLCVCSGVVLSVLGAGGLGVPTGILGM